MRAFAAFRHDSQCSVLRAAAMGVLIILLAGCTAIKMGYNNAETLSMFYINRYFDLDSTQEDLVRPRVRNFLAWHRATQMPDYVVFAGEIKKRVAGTITTNDVVWLDAQLRERWHRMTEKAVPDMADLALALKAPQIQQLEKQFADENKTYYKERVAPDPEGRRKFEYEKSLDRAEYWLGTLSRDQRTTLRSWTDALPVDPDLRYQERLTRQRELVALLNRVLEQKPPRDKVIQMINDYLAHLEAPPDNSHRSYIQNLEKANIEMTVRVAGMATTRQRDHALAKVQDFADDFATIAKDPGN